ncbi:MAG: TlpA disulfide reductase family protein [Halioglobus sp.]|nr:TlpA disulfide reductase family protein [Halioglobus sp.]
MRAALYLVLLCALTACSTDRRAETPKGLDQLRGQWVLVNYWAQWCKPCIEEIPELNALDKSRDDVTVLGVNFEGAVGEELAQQEETLGVQFATVDDPSAQLGIARPVVLPTTLLVNPQGALVDTLLGPQTHTSLEAAISAAAAP